MIRENDSMSNEDIHGHHTHHQFTSLHLETVAGLRPFRSAVNLDYARYEPSVFGDTPVRQGCVVETSLAPMDWHLCQLIGLRPNQPLASVSLAAAWSEEEGFDSSLLHGEIGLTWLITMESAEALVVSGDAALGQACTENSLSFNTWHSGVHSFIEAELTGQESGVTHLEAVMANVLATMETNAITLDAEPEALTTTDADHSLRTEKIIESSRTPEHQAKSATSNPYHETEIYAPSKSSAMGWVSHSAWSTSSAESSTYNARSLVFKDDQFEESLTSNEFGIHTSVTLAEDQHDSTEGASRAHAHSNLNFETERQHVLEFGSASLNHLTSTVQLEAHYQNPIVIASIRTSNGSQPVSVRIESLAGNNISFRLSEPEYLDGWHKHETVDFLVVEAGTWRLTDGTLISAGTHQVEQIGEAGSSSVDVDVSQFDVFFSQRQTANHQFWATARLDRSEASLRSMLQVEEGLRDGMASIHVSETIGWVAIDAPDGSLYSLEGLGLGMASGIDHQTIEVSLASNTSEDLTIGGVLHDMTSFRGPDTASSRGNALTESGFTVRIQEEQSRDQEIRHTGEQIELLYFTEEARGRVIFGHEVPTTQSTTELLARDDSFEVMGSAPVALDVLGNDTTSTEGADQLGLSISSSPHHGAAYIDSEGQMIFLPDNNSTATDSFEYTIVNQSHSSSTAEVQVTFSSVQDGETFHQEPELIAEAEMLLGLIPRSTATHIAVRDGNWFDPTTWSNGQIPGDNATVLIPPTIAVNYDGVSIARLKAVRVEGQLSFDTDDNTSITVETLLTTQNSSLEIGTDENPIAPSVTAEVIFWSDGSVPNMMERGLITGGDVSIVGSDKTDFATINGQIQAGDQVLRLNEEPVGWQIGDSLVVGGTSYNSEGRDEDNSRFRDEVIVIQEIIGNEIRFVNSDTNDNTFRFDHSLPTDYDDKLSLYVGNLSRNLTLRSESYEENDDRGHVMLMHDRHQVIKNAAFLDLGRSDKAVLVDDMGINRDGSMGQDESPLGTNPRGRYSLHFHRNLSDQEDSAAIAQGNVIWGSPGWGIVSHDSRVDVRDNIVFDVVGAGIVAESGNETGQWTDNLTIKMTGDQDPDPSLSGTARVSNFDFGFNGDGYWVQGAPLVELKNNISISTARTGLSLFVDVDGNRNKDWSGLSVPVSSLSTTQRELYLSNGYSPEDEINIRSALAGGISGFTSYNAGFGIEIWHHLRNDDGLNDLAGRDGHTLHSSIEDFDLWGIRGEGIFAQYSTQIDFRNGLVIGNPDDPIEFNPGNEGRSVGRGFGSNNPAHQFNFENLIIDGFEVGIKLPNEAGSIGGPSVEKFKFNSSSLTNVELRNVDQAFDPGAAPFESTADLPAVIIFDSVRSRDLPAGNAGPIALVDFEALGGPGMIRLDASSSFDPDSPPFLKASGGGIAAYGWDFDLDGTVDAWGREVTHAFHEIGQHTLSLSLWDASGQVTTTSISVESRDISYPNLIRDASFDLPIHQGRFYDVTPKYADRGWFAHDWITEEGSARSQSSSINNGLWQVVHDERARVGAQTLSFDVENIDLDGVEQTLSVSVWGFDTDFSHKAGDFRDSQRYGPALELSGTLLLHETLEANDDAERRDFRLDLGDGFEFISVSFSSRALNIAQGEEIAIARVALTDGSGILAEDDFFNVSGGQVTSLDVLRNDFDLAGGDLELVDISQAAGGTARLQDSRIVFEPDLTFSGRTRIEYGLIDANNNRAAASLYLDVDPISTEALILASRFDEGIGRVSMNFAEAPIEPYLTHFNDSKWRDGVSGHAIEFDGVDDFVPLEYVAGFSGVGPWGDGLTHERSVCFWFQSDSPEDPDKQVMFQEGVRGTGMSIYLEDGLLVAETGSERTGWQSTRLFSGSHDLERSAWHHVALTLSSASESIALWLDGELVDHGYGEAYQRSPGGEVLGASNSVRKSVASAHAFDGAIDELRFYDRALGADEISTLSQVVDWMV